MVRSGSDLFLSPCCFVCWLCQWGNEIYVVGLRRVPIREGKQPV